MLVIPYGGCGEFGRNLTAYVVGETMIFADCGIQMPDDTTPGVDHLIPDFSPLFARFGPPAAVFLTHGHEDHIGAVGYLLREVDAAVPVYGRPLTLHLAERRLDRLGVGERLRDFRKLEPRREVIVAATGEAASSPRFSVTPLAMPHSIPEACALLIASCKDDAPRRLVLHTGDFKLDEMGGFDVAEPVDLVVGDSTNAGVPGKTGCERDVSHALAALAEDPARKGRLVVALFSSHIERIGSFAEACRRGGRRLCLLGRGLHDATAAAARAGVLSLPDGVLCSADEAATLPPHKVALLCTGTQGERVAALGRLAAALEPESRAAFGGLRLSSGDTVVLSARIIPGHERPVGRLLDRLAMAGIDVLVGSPYSVSGHGSREDLRELLRAARPRALLPVHGAPRQLHAHAVLAEEMGVPALRCQNGDVIEIGATLQVIDHLPSRALCVEGTTIGTVGPETLRMRHRLSCTGVVAVAVDPATPGGLLVSALGVSDEGADLADLCREAARNAAAALRTFEENRSGRWEAPGSRRLVVTRAVRSTFARRRGIKPTVLTVLGGTEVGYDEGDEPPTDAAF
jgi:ribonuclease J